MVTEGPGPLLSLPLVATKKLVFPTLPPQDQSDLSYLGDGALCLADLGWPPLTVLPLPAGQCPTERLQPGAVPDPVGEERGNHIPEERGRELTEGQRHHGRWALSGVGLSPSPLGSFQHPGPCPLSPWAGVWPQRSTQQLLGSQGQ